MPQQEHIEGEVRYSVPRRILFIGNSFTARNNLPGLLAQMATARGKRIEHRLISAGGASLRRHWNTCEALRVIEKDGFDHIVLQEQSTLPIKNPKRMHESVRLFDQAIKAADARTVLYMTWARLNAPASQQAITEAYVSIARELRAWGYLLGYYSADAPQDAASLIAGISRLAVLS